MKKRLYIYIVTILLLSQFCWAESRVVVDATADLIIIGGKNSKSKFKYKADKEKKQKEKKQKEKKVKEKPQKKKPAKDETQNDEVLNDETADVTIVPQKAAPSKDKGKDDNVKTKPTKSVKRKKEPINEPNIEEIEQEEESQDDETVEETPQPRKKLTKSEFAQQCGFYGFLDYNYTPLVLNNCSQMLNDFIRMNGSIALGARVQYWLLYYQSEIEYWAKLQDNSLGLQEMFLRNYFTFGYDIYGLFKVTLSSGMSVFSKGNNLFEGDSFLLGPGFDFRLYVGPENFYVSMDLFLKTDFLFDYGGNFLPNLNFGMRLNLFPYIQSLSLYVEPSFLVSPNGGDFYYASNDTKISFALSAGMRFTADVAKMRSRIAAWKSGKHFGDFYHRKSDAKKKIRDEIELDRTIVPTAEGESYIAEIPKNRRNYINVPDSDFVRVRGVTFKPDQKAGAFKEGADSVTIPEYYICKYEVTQALYRRVLAHDEDADPTPSYNSPKNVEVVPFDEEKVDQRPVDCVTWYDALYFCNAYSRRECLDEVYTIKNIKRDENKHIISAIVTADFSKNGYRLPTEAEWELAARGGDPTNKQDWNHIYSGDDDLGTVGWFYDNAALRGEGNPGYGSHQAALHKPNSLGIFDMSGNVSEWCWDEVRDSRSGKSTKDKNIQSVNAMRVICGGNWHNDAEACEITYRDYSDRWKGQSHTYDGLGFRLVRTTIQTDERLSPKVVLNGDFKLIHGRTFRPNEEVGAFAGLEEVTIGDYYMSLYPVSQILYRYVLRDEADVNADPSFCAADNGVHIPAADEIPLLRPVEYVTWYDAVFFCNVYSRLMGYKEAYTISNIIRNKDKHIISANVTVDTSKDGFRLPSEIEWEYAARGANPNNAKEWNAVYAGSDNPDGVSWYLNNAGDRVGRGKAGYGTHEVGMLRPNSLGIYDISGNVWEWCQSTSGTTARKTSRPGIARKEYRICRGGSWFRNENYCKTLSRNDWLPDQWASDMGFRVVRTKTAAAVRKVKTADSVKFDFVHVPHGRVECNETEGAFTEERGFVNVKSFYMSRYEVTQALYATVLFGDSKVNSNPSGCVITDGQFPAVDGESETHRPVENITWYDAVYFCNAYSKYDRLEPVYTMSNIVRDSARHIIKAVVKADFSRNGYRLPTEIEWEYAARGGNQSSDTWNDVYSGSNAVYDVAWYKENAGYAIGAGHIGYGTHHVGKRFSNALELFDMSGNAAEMCWDKYASKLDASVGGDGPAEGSRNVIRGGSWSDAPFACAVTARGSVSPSDRFLNYGFRVVRNDLEDNWEGEDLQDDQMSAGDGFVRIPAASVKCTDTKGAFSEARGTVRIEEYYISKYPVTIDLYRDIMSHCADCNPSPSYCARSSDFDKLLRDEEPNMRPVESVSWFDAVFFCNEYSRQMGLEPVYTITDIVRDEAFRSIRSANVTADFNKNGYRLPTRIEWEYAARGADADNEAWKFKYAGSDSLDEVGWYWRNIHGGFGKRVIAAGTRGYGTHHVGRKKANSIGLYDMSGNVQQWCWDWYSENIDADTPLLGAESGLYRVACGGAWNLEEDACQVTSDGSDFPYDTDDNRGIRLVRSGDRAAVETRNVIVGAFADIQGGTFIMGDDSKYGVAANKPHSVTVDSFSIGITPVTQREWASIMDSNPSHYQNAAEGEDADLLPVESISWIDAVRYCNMLSIHRGLRPCYAVNGQTDPAYWGDTTNVEWDQSADGYRLPTEAEWEYAARGGIIGTAKSPSLYSGIGELDDVSWYESNSEGRTHQVELKSRNEMGLTDMSGNVWEWCWDWYGAEYYKDNQVNPTGPKSGKMRVNRGGAFDSYGANGTIGYRSSDYPTRKFRNVGLRLARNTGSIAIMGN